MRDLVFVVVSSLLVVFASSQDLPARKFEYKFSFKGPYLSQKDGTVPFWHYSGNAIASDENVRITPSLRSQKGQMWTKQKTDFDWWEVELIFRITGRGRVGADGLAFWFTENRGREGPVFGSSDEWKGLGLFFDSFDNDNKHNNPYIMAVVNDGTMRFDHQTDGSAQQLAGCLRDFRNKPYPVRAKIEYYRNVLTVMINNGVTNNPNDYEMCFRAENVFLPPSGHFGLSAATGGLADDHDVLKLLTYSLRPVLDGTGGGGGGQQQMGRVSEAEKEKLTQEYQNFQQKLDTQRKEYHEKHPEAKKEEHGDYEWFEEEQTKELRQIFQGQSSMFEVLRDLHRKVDELIGRSERTMSLLAQQQQMQGGVMPVQGGVPPPPPPSGGQGGMMRHEVDQLMAATRELVQMGRDIKAYTLEIHQKSNQIIGNQAKQPVGQGSVQPVGGGYDVHAMVNEVKEGINALRREVTGTNPNQKAGSCDFSQVKCVSVTVLVVFLISQVAVIVGYLAWKDSRESNMKKFY